MAELSKEVVKALENLNNAILCLEDAVGEKNRNFESLKKEHQELTLKCSKLKPEVVKITARIDEVINSLKVEE